MFSLLVCSNKMFSCGFEYLVFSVGRPHDKLSCHLQGMYKWCRCNTNIFKVALNLEFLRRERNTLKTFTCASTELMLECLWISKPVPFYAYQCKKNAPDHGRCSLSLIYVQKNRQMCSNFSIATVTVNECYWSRLVTCLSYKEQER